MKFNQVVLVNQPSKEFRWKGKLFVSGIFDGELYFRLVLISTNQSKLIHRVKFTGILSALIFKSISANTKDGFISMNLALKKQLEKRLEN